MQALRFFSLAVAALAVPLAAGAGEVVRGPELPFYAVIEGFLMSWTAHEELGEPVAQWIGWNSPDLGKIHPDVQAGYWERNRQAGQAPAAEVDREALRALVWKYREMGRRLAEAHRRMVGLGYPLDWPAFLRRVEELGRSGVLSRDVNYERDLPYLEEAWVAGAREVYPHWEGRPSKSRPAPDL